MSVNVSPGFLRLDWTAARLGLVAFVVAICSWSACGAEESPPAREEIYQAVSAGSIFSCGLRLDGSIRCWGRNEGNEEKGFLEAPEDGNFVPVASGYYGYYGSCASGRRSPEVLGPGRRREQTLHEILGA